MKNLFYYTNECAICGKGKIATVNQIRPQIEEAGLDLFVKQVPIYVGWQEEVKELGEEIPFFYNPHNGMVASFDDIFQKDSENYEVVNEENLKQLLKI